jgi:uncharacterized protein (DUF1330 family)
MYKSHRDISKEKAQFTKTSKELIDEYQNNLETTTTKYLDKTIEVNGKVTDVESDNFTLNNVIVCYTDSVTIKKIKLTEEINVKGRSIGYDELLEYIKLDKVTIINN